MMKTFYVGIKGVIVKDDKLLMLKTSEIVRGNPLWEFPGGRIDDDETVEQALLRELGEELPNIKNVQIGEILSARRLHHDIDGDKSLVLVFHLVTADFDGEIQLSNEHTEYRWLSKGEAHELTQDISHEAVMKAFERAG